MVQIVQYTPKFTGLFKDQFRTAQSLDSMASAEREPITGVWGRSPQRRSRRQSPRWRVWGGEAPWSWIPFCFYVSKGSCKFAPLLIFAKVRKSHSEWMSHCLTTHLQRIYMLSRRSYPLTYSCPWIQTIFQSLPSTVAEINRGSQFFFGCSPGPRPRQFWS